MRICVLGGGGGGVERCEVGGGGAEFFDRGLNILTEARTIIFSLRFVHISSRFRKMEPLYEKRLTS